MNPSRYIESLLVKANETEKKLTNNKYRVDQQTKFVEKAFKIGLIPFPLGKKSKLPAFSLYKSWKVFARNPVNLKRIKERINQNHNIGLTMPNNSNIIVVDVDQSKDLSSKETLEKLFQYAPHLKDTPISKTKNGFHLFVKVTKEQPANGAKFTLKNGKGEIDIRSHFNGLQGYITGSFSVHPDGGFYLPFNGSLDNLVEIDSLESIGIIKPVKSSNNKTKNKSTYTELTPEQLKIENSTLDKVKQKIILEDLSKRPDSISGQGGQGAFYHVCALLVEGYGLTVKEALPFANWFSNNKSSPSWSQKEIFDKLNDAYEKEALKTGKSKKEIKEKYGKRKVGYLFDSANKEILQKEIKEHIKGLLKPDLTINKKYIPVNIDIKNRKFIVIQANQGTGKTEQMKTIKKNNPDAIIIVLAHRVSLLEQIGKTLDIPVYNDEEMIEYLKKNGSYPTGSIVVTVDSFHKLSKETDGKKVILIIDEADQVARQLVGSTVNGTEQEIYTSLVTATKAASKVYLMSADMNDKPVNHLIKSLGANKENTYTLENTYSKEKRAYPFQTRPSLLKKMVETIEKGGKVVAHSTNKNGKYSPKENYNYCKKKFPSKKFLYVDSTNSSKPEIIEMLKNPKLLNVYDGVFYSPSLQSGVNFNLPYYKDVFLFANSLHGSTATDCIQGISRFRDIENLYYWVSNDKKKTEYKNEDFAMIKKELLDYNNMCYSKLNISKTLKNFVKQNTKVNPDNSRERLPVEGYEVLLDLYCLNKASENFSINRFKSLFNALLIKRGFVSKYAESIEPTKEEKKEVTLSLKESLEQKKEDILNAVDIDDTDLELIDKKNYKTDEEQNQVDKYFYIKANGGKEELEKAVDIPLKTLQKRVKSFSSIMDFYNSDFVRIKDKEEQLEKLGKRLSKKLGEETLNITPYNQRNQLKDLLILKDIEETIGLLFTDKKGKLNGFKVGNEKEVLRLQKYIKKNRSKIEKVFNVTDKMVEKPSYFIRGFFSLLGLKTQRIGKGKNRKLVVEEKGLSFMMGVYNRHKENESNKVADGGFYSLEATLDRNLSSVTFEPRHDIETGSSKKLSKGEQILERTRREKPYVY